MRLPIPTAAPPGDPIVLTLNSTIDAVDVTPNPAYVALGGTLALTATAKNADSATVLVPATGGFTWEVTEGSSSASVDENGVVTGGRRRERDYSGHRGGERCLGNDCRKCERRSGDRFTQLL